MTRPRESDYTSHTSYTRALEAYCDSLESRKQYVEGQYPKPSRVYDITGAEPPPPDSGFARLESL